MSLFNKEEINARFKKSIQGKVPKLKCLISGIERVTSMEYLKTKEEKFGSIDNFLKNYICSEAVKLLRQNKTILEIKNTLNPECSHVPCDKSVDEAKVYYGI
jgi:hypothetical protein